MSVRRPCPTATSLCLLDAELARGAGRQSHLRLRAGELLAALDKGHRDLGFATLGSYMQERCSRSGGWAKDSRVVARRAADRPALRDAFLRRRISWSVLELLLRHDQGEGTALATAESDMELLDATDGVPVRALRAVLKAVAVRRGASAELDEDAAENQPRRLRLTVPVEDALAIEQAEQMIRQLDGGEQPAGYGSVGRDDMWLESLLSEGLSTLMFMLDQEQEALPDDILRRFEAVRRERQRAIEREQSMDDGEARSGWRGQAEAADGHLDDGVFDRPLPSDPLAIDAELRAVCAEMDSCDLFFGGLALRFWGVQGWRALGFESDVQYARDRLGVSRSSVQARMALAKRTAGLRQVTQAMASGRLGFEAAGLISRVANQCTEVAWIERAALRTFKHLREEVRAVGLLARLESRPLTAGPPTEEELERVLSMQRDARSGQSARDAVGILLGPVSEFDDADAEGAESTSISAAASSDDPEPTRGALSELSHREAVVQMSGTLPFLLAQRLELNVANAGRGAQSLGRTTVVLQVSEDVAFFFREVETMYAESGLGGRFLPFLVSALFHAWHGVLGDMSKWEAIHRRDRYECTSPVCSCRDVTLHHLEYRGYGGGDEPENVASLCSFCHLDGEHGGRLQVRGRASEPTWTLGSVARPTMVVQGRRVLS